MSDFVPVSMKSIVSSLNSKVFRLTLMPTEHCNFRCTYCYEDFEIGRMTAETIQGVKALIAHRIEGLDVLVIDWFGGEPLLASNIMLEIMRYTKELCAGEGVKFKSSITTNGYKLSLALAKELSELNMYNYQISLDGDEQAHNETRRHAGGQGTFDVIWNNLLAMKRSSIEFSVVLRLHLTPTNDESMKSLVGKIQEHILPDSRFKVFLKPVGNWGGPNTGSIRTLDGRSSFERVKYLKGLLAGPISTEVNNRVQTPEVSEYICYAASPNALVIRADGRVAKCTVAFSDEVNTVGKLSVEGTVTLDVDKMQLWMRGFEERDAASLECPYRGIHTSKGNIPLAVVE